MTLPGFIGSSPDLRRVYKFAKKAAASARPVLLTGETGTGKTAMAKAIQQLSGNTGPFVNVVLPEIHPNLFETHLFGCKKGAYTGAIADQKGFIESANGGTLFLDEIAELPPYLQAKLLGVLSSAQFRRVGDTTVRRSEFRLIAATNADLPAMVGKGTFRADLYYRLAGLQCRMPSLTNRPADIKQYVTEWMAKHGQGKRMSKAALHHLMVRQWPGNYRELESALGSLVDLADGQVIYIESKEQHP